jgi:type VI secretion system protein ImpD
MNATQGRFQGNAAISTEQAAGSRAGEARRETIGEETALPKPAGLLDEVLQGTRSGEGPVSDKLERFLGEPSPAAALALWTGWIAAPGARPDKEQLCRLLGRDIARLDAVLTRQVNAILHHPSFQKLEASWRGLRYLVEQSENAENVKIRLLSVSWREIARDAERAIEFDQSQLFRKVYSDEFGTPGGEPFSVLLGDYQIRPFPSAEYPTDDVAALTAVSHVAAAAFAPFIASADPAMFALDDFTGLQQPLNLSKTFDQLEYLKWRAFRDTEDARFVGLTMPRVLARLPYEDDGSRVDGFRFREETEGPDRGKYLWGSAAYAFGAVLVRAFDRSGWLAGIRGVSRDDVSGGLAPDLPVHCFTTDRRGVAPKCSTDAIITDAQEHELSELGFIPLCHCADTELSAFFTNQSVQKPRVYDEPAATMNARISAMLQYMLCVSRFSHYLKVAARDKIGSFTEAEQCESYLYKWLQQYVTSDGDATPEVKAEYPLREAGVRVREQPGKPGSYLCVAHLWPHYELDELVATVKVTTELTPGVPV